MGTGAWPGELGTHDRPVRSIQESPVRSYTLPAFGGLDLRDDPQDAIGAVDCLNIDFDRPGRVRTRDGYTQLNAGSSENVIHMVHYGTAGRFVTLDATAHKGRVRDNTGASVALSNASASSLLYNLTNLGTPTASYVYGGCGDVLGRLLRWDGAAWTYPVVGYSSLGVAVTPWDNRLALAYEISPATNDSRVRFSDPGAPETYGANNYVDLTPGDNEFIGSIVTWRDRVFVFKQTKFFVFYATDTDSTGNPVFRYRTVNAGVGLGTFTTVSSGVQAVAMDDAVYFVSAQGLYRTTGDLPEKVSGPVDPIFGIGSAAYLTTSATITGTNPTIGRFGRKVFICYAAPSSGSAFVLLYDTEHNTWSLWNTAMASMLEYRSTQGAAPKLLFADTSGAFHTMATATTTDNGSAITSRYRTAFMDLGTPDAEKHIRELIFDGTGTITSKRAVNDLATLSSGQSVALGTSPAVAQNRDRRGIRGRNLSVDISATSGQWTLNRMTVNVMSERASGAKATL